MINLLNYRTGLSDIPDYDIADCDYKIKLNANESNRNLPPLVAERLISRISAIAFNRYPSEESFMLQKQIANAYSLTIDNVILGNGSSEIIEKVFFAFGGDREHRIVVPVPSFSMYATYAHMANATFIPCYLNDNLTLDKDKFITLIEKNNASLAVLCNPNNPTGLAIPVRDIQYIADNIKCSLLIDEAYMEFCEHSATSLLQKCPNIMIARTFSKAYALASCRVGYMLAAADVIKHLRRVFMPYHLNTMSLVAADTVFQMRYEYDNLITETISERHRISTYLNKYSNLTTYPSEANFILIRHPRIQELNNLFATQKIGVRDFNNGILTDALRISIGLADENDSWLKILNDFMEDLDGTTNC